MAARNNDLRATKGLLTTVLDDGHEKALYKAVTNVLSLDVTIKAFAQILDGLPTVAAAGAVPKDHPIVQLQHRDICDGYLAKASALQELVNPSTFVFQPWVLWAFQQATPGTKQFSLWLVELVVVSCHQIAACLYERDAGAHKHQLHRDWYAMAERGRLSGQRPRGAYPRPVAFSHVAYWRPDLCPRGEADVAALPYTLYPPTETQFDALVAFLLSSPHDDDHRFLRAACPLPIHATNDNRPRWDPWEALTKFHIFRDNAALAVPTVRSLGCTSIRPIDWPESLDRRTVYDLMRKRDSGEEYDAEKLAAAQAGISWVTPTSPYSHPKPDWLQNSIWNGR
ncbi:hypothetical protein SPI_01142 [Niveomyces insectorum RCEF 264]|uniref:Uncharacterized protein n=1 Tax=Niveomyces insectorum RCEF 264 TaxID=1081102 RepID=A0A167YQ92_9HYPO|nr:hypothetical protein SPI_01142 [Niveomyces insectorum RCEF 264]